MSATHLWRQRQGIRGGAAGRPEARQGWDAEWDFQNLRHTEEGSKQARKQASSLMSQTVEVRVPATGSEAICVELGRMDFSTAVACPQGPEILFLKCDYHMYTGPF